MVFDNPDDDARARVAFELLAELTETDDDLNLLIAVIRVYRAVKRERQQQKCDSALTVVKTSSKGRQNTHAQRQRNQDR